jgi:hypothetical protein
VSLRPQHLTPPACVRAQACSSPAVIALTLEARPATSTGSVLHGSGAPWPGQVSGPTLAVADGAPSVVTPILDASAGGQSAGVICSYSDGRDTRGQSNHWNWHSSGSGRSISELAVRVEPRTLDAASGCEQASVAARRDSGCRRCTDGKGISLRVADALPGAPGERRYQAEK